MIDYVYAYTSLCKGACVLDPLRNVDDDYELLRGIPRALEFPPSARFDFDKDFGIKLQDTLKNTQRLLVVCERMMEFLRRDNLAGNEILPVTIHDAKGRPIVKYFIIHQVGLQDCLDLSKTIGRRNPINPELFISVSTLVIDETRIDPKLGLFRLKFHPMVLIVKRSLAELIAHSEFTGITFGEIAEYDQFKSL